MFKEYLIQVQLFLDKNQNQTRRINFTGSGINPVVIN